MYGNAGIKLDIAIMREIKKKYEGSWMFFINVKLFGVVKYLFNFLAISWNEIRCRTPTSWCKRDPRSVDYGPVLWGSMSSKAAERRTVLSIEKLPRFSTHSIQPVAYKTRSNARTLNTVHRQPALLVHHPFICFIQMNCQTSSLQTFY